LGHAAGLKNLTDHFLEEWFWRPAAIASYSAGPSPARAPRTAWHGTLSEMGMVVISSTIAVGPIRRPVGGRQADGEVGNALAQRFRAFADDLRWWIEAAKAQRHEKKPPY
jgi:NAD(P)H-dependent FMN reductase